MGLRELSGLALESLGIKSRPLILELPSYPSGVPIFQDPEKLALISRIPLNEQWGSITYTDPYASTVEDRRPVTTRVPFTKAELNILERAGKSNRRLITLSGSSSGPEREYSYRGNLFPSGDHAKLLLDREETIKRVASISAEAAQRLAEKFSQGHISYLKRPEQQQAIRDFIEIRDLLELFLPRDNVVNKDS